MGYCSTFWLKWSPTSTNVLTINELHHAIIGALRHPECGLHSAVEYPDYEDYRIAAYDIQWYNVREDMQELSKKFPTLLFEMYVEGENQGDMWKGRWQNGKMEIITPTLVWGEFKELKEMKE